MEKKKISIEQYNSIKKKMVTWKISSQTMERQKGENYAQSSAFNKGIDDCVEILKGFVRNQK